MISISQIRRLYLAEAMSLAKGWFSHDLGYHRHRAHQDLTSRLVDPRFQPRTSPKSALDLGQVSCPLWASVPSSDKWGWG